MFTFRLIFNVKIEIYLLKLDSIEMGTYLFGIGQVANVILHAA